MMRTPRSSSAGTTLGEGLYESREHGGCSGSSSREYSRRNFIKGVIAAGATVSASAYLFRTDIARPERARMAGSVERLITLDVNGQQRRVDVLKHETLAMTLRYKLGLTGTKLGCDRAECGACTVLVDDVPHYSCSVLTHTVRGKKIVSIEGLATPDGTLHPVQQAVVDGQGFQCAFCMPGFVMATVGFLKTNPEPDPRAARARHLRQPVPLCRLQQDPRLHDERSRIVEEGVDMAETHNAAGLEAKLIRQQLHRRRTWWRRSPARRNTPRTSAPTACCSSS